jgi:hypothetical protein
MKGFPFDRVICIRKIQQFPEGDSQEDDCLPKKPHLAMNFRLGKRFQRSHRQTQGFQFEKAICIGQSREGLLSTNLEESKK